MSRARKLLRQLGEGKRAGRALEQARSEPKFQSAGPAKVKAAKRWMAHGRATTAPRRSRLVPG